jgi:hypothetical protein
MGLQAMDQNIPGGTGKDQGVLLPSAVDLWTNIVMYVLPALPLNNYILLTFKPFIEILFQIILWKQLNSHLIKIKLKCT